jgi:hypothetical protein
MRRLWPGPAGVREFTGREAANTLGTTRARRAREREVPVSETVACYMLKRLTAWGVKRVYAYPGDGIDGLLGAFHEVGDELEFVQTRHQEIASFAACRIEEMLFDGLPGLREGVLYPLLERPGLGVEFRERYAV